MQSQIRSVRWDVRDAPWACPALLNLTRYNRIKGFRALIFVVSKYDCNFKSGLRWIYGEIYWSFAQNDKWRINLIKLLNSSKKLQTKCVLWILWIDVLQIRSGMCFSSYWWFYIFFPHKKNSCTMVKHNTAHAVCRIWELQAYSQEAELISISFLRDQFGRHHLHTAVNCLVNYRAGVIKTDLYITRSGECVCLVNLIKQQVQNQVIWLWCAPCENDKQTKILIWAAFPYFCMEACTLQQLSPCIESHHPKIQMGVKWTVTSDFPICARINIKTA